jgi:REP element-mobilizing transposase RayT
MPREARIDYPGVLHHVIGRGIERRDIFKEKTDKDDFLHRLKSILSRSNMQCYAWCVMDNHFHLLLLTGTTTSYRNNPLIRIYEKIINRIRG